MSLLKWMSKLTLAGGCALLVPAALLPWLESAGGGNMALGGVTVSWHVVVLVVGLILLGAGAMTTLMIRSAVQASAAEWLGWLCVILVGALTGLGFWYSYFLNNALQAYEWRYGVQTGLFAVAAAMLAVGSARMQVDRRLRMLVRRMLLVRPKYVVAVGMLIVLVAGGLIGWFVMDAMPHISDSVSYVIQGRMYWSGRPAIESPKYPEFFYKSLQLFGGPVGHYGKFPPGWPVVLGLGDLLGVGFLVNALLACGLVFVTYVYVRGHVGRRVATATVWVMALTPWLWLNAGSWHSHLASAFWLMLFLLGYHEALRIDRVRAGTVRCGWSLLGGVAMAMELFTRPQDVVFFVGPAAVYGLYVLYRRVKVTLLPMIVYIAVAGGGALGFVLWNRMLTGSGGQSPYGRGYMAELARMSPGDPLRYVVWLQENLVHLNHQWFAGGFPVLVLAALGVWLGRRWLVRAPLLAWSGLWFACCYCVVVFGGRAWVGPRWYVPLIPVVSFAVACALVGALRPVPARRLALRLIVTVFVIGLLVALPARLVYLCQYPPHGVDGRVVAAIDRDGLSNAVIGFPVEEDYPWDAVLYFGPRTAMWSMQVPFESSDVICIRAVDDWQLKAAECWPGRRLYRIEPAGKTVRFVPVSATTQQGAP